MRHAFWIAVALSLTLAGSMASAQYPYGFKTPGMQPLYKPPVSPYLNLVRQGNSPAFNYLTLVKPQLQAQKNFQSLQDQYGTVQQAVSSLEQQTLPGGVPALPVTGQPVGFMTHKGYFMNLQGVATIGTGGAVVGGTGPGALAPKVGNVAGKKK
jgi:hypothetical protein